MNGGEHRRRRVRRAGVRGTGAAPATVEQFHAGAAARANRVPRRRCRARSFRCVAARGQDKPEPLTEGESPPRQGTRTLCAGEASVGTLQQSSVSGRVTLISDGRNAKPVTAIAPIGQTAAQRPQPRQPSSRKKFLAAVQDAGGAGLDAAVAFGVT